MPLRQAHVERTTTETSITLDIVIDGTGTSDVQTTIPFLDHMLTILAKHALLNLTLRASGDTKIDDHHLIEDIGITLGDAFRKALGEKKGIRRFASLAVPLDESLAHITLDISGRPYLLYQVPLPQPRIKDLDLNLFEEFFRAFVVNAAITLHITVPYGRNSHHIMEAIFKGMAKAIEHAASEDHRIQGIPSTKGSL
ncbi:MAG: imidazoleglycerol-phosphate dehydratase [Nitrospiraceae bacterium]|nr:imidazoleglycerol-phosphate dehydratase [Nitrospiraceae bacterium]|tara:strand:- start:7702 stop:8292 length:591 start_codon:yes stop_codon:yes gene_type:complete